MTDTIITLGNNLQPPHIDMEVTKEIYECVKTEEFDYVKFNSLLATVVTYLDAHGVEYGDKALPWAEEVVSD